MNGKRELNPGDQQPKDESRVDAPERELVDLGDARMETHGSAGGALDMPISGGHY